MNTVLARAEERTTLEQNSYRLAENLPNAPLLMYPTSDTGPCSNFTTRSRVRPRRFSGPIRRWRRTDAMGRATRYGCSAIGVVFVLVGAAAHSAERASPLDPERVDFVMGNFQFALLHELAHVAIGDLEPPIIGPEEYAADYLATISLLRPLQSPRVGAEKWLKFAMTAADAFAILWQVGEEAGARSSYWDTHALSIQRFYSIACLIYGSDPRRFAKVPELIQMPMQRAGSCEAEYARALKSTDWLLSFAASHRNPSASVGMSVRYERPRSRTDEYLVAEIESRGLIEWTLKRFDQLVPLDKGATLVLRSCSIPEAAWVAERRELIVCYELLDLYYLLSANQHRGAIESLQEQ